MAETTSTSELKDRSCKPCEGGVPALGASETRTLLQRLDGWELAEDGRRIRRRWTMRDFAAAIRFLQRVAELAEAEGHHPDVHLTGYRHLTIELTTHAIDGLSENDFILAAKIDELEAPTRAGSR